MKKIRIYYEMDWWFTIQTAVNKALAEYGLQIELEKKQEEVEKIYIEKVEDNVSRNYENKYDCRSVRGDAALFWNLTRNVLKNNHGNTSNSF